MKRKYLFLSFAYIALASSFVAACGHKDETRGSLAYRGETYEVKLQTIDDVKPVAGTLTTRQMSQATARVSGILTSMKVREGDMVTQGQVIAFVQDQRLDLQTHAYEASTSAAQAQADLARAALARTQSLFDKGIYAQAKLDQDKAAALAAEANVRAARAQASASGEGAHQGAILAPSTGKVLHATMPVGSVVMAGQAVAIITSGHRVVRIELPEAQAMALRQGQSLSLDANGSKATGTISEIYPSVTEGQITADLNADGLDQVVIGQKIIAYIGLGHRSTLVLPKRFIISRFGLDYVQILQKDGSLLETTVQTSPTGDPDRIEILGGLNIGDKLAAYGASQ